MASALCNVQDGNAAAVAAGNGQNVTPGNTVTVSLVTTTGVTAWIIKAIWTNGTVSEFAFSAAMVVSQAAFTATFTAPAEGTGFVLYSEVISSTGIDARQFGLYCKGAGDVGVTFPTDPAQLLLALQSPRFQPPAELAAAPGAALPKVRAVTTSIAAYAGTGTGTLTGSANGALAAQDGLTMAVGDVLHIPAGLANVTAADAGPYVVTNLGTASTKFGLTRPGWYAHGSTATAGMGFDVFAGTIYGGSVWKATAVGSVVGTTDAVFVPREVTQSIVLVTGTAAAITNVPTLGGTKTSVAFHRTVVNTPSATIMYAVVAALTAGVMGISSVVPMAVVGAGTINAADISTLNVTIRNQV